MLTNGYCIILHKLESFPERAIVVLRSFPASGEVNTGEGLDEGDVAVCNKSRA